MGAWGTNIKDNDTTADIYTDFFEMYNNGQNPADISRNLIKKNRYLINNPDDSNNFWFAIALGQWETKSLEPHIFEKVKETAVNLDRMLIKLQSISDVGAHQS